MRTDFVTDKVLVCEQTAGEVALILKKTPTFDQHTTAPALRHQFWN